MKRVTLRNVAVDAGTLTEVVAQLTRWMDERAPRYVSCAPVHLIEMANRDERVARALANADMVLADGLPVALLARVLSHTPSEQISGSALFDALCRQSGDARHFFYGSTPPVLERIRANIKLRYPGIIVAGVHSPPFRPLTPAEHEDELQMISKARPSIIWVGLGAPKQDLWMMTNGARLPAPAVGVGAVFDFVAGTKRRAPRLFRDAGLEWLFRLASEPRRLGPRYLSTNISFLAGVPRTLIDHVSNRTDFINREARRP